MRALDSLWRAELSGVGLEGDTDVGPRRVDGLSLVIDINGIAVRGPEPGALRLMPWQALQSLRFHEPAVMADGRPATVLVVGVMGRELRFVVPASVLPWVEARAVESRVVDLVGRLRSGRPVPRGAGSSAPGPVLLAEPSPADQIAAEGAPPGAPRVVSSPGAHVPPPPATGLPYHAGAVPGLPVDVRLPPPPATGLPYHAGGVPGLPVDVRLPPPPATGLPYYAGGVPGLPVDVRLPPPPATGLPYYAGGVPGLPPLSEVVPGLPPLSEAVPGLPVDVQLPPLSEVVPGLPVDVRLPPLSEVVPGLPVDVRLPPLSEVVALPAPTPPVMPPPPPTGWSAGLERQPMAFGES
nr:hypothetical protein [Actinomycetota bacterium]